MMLDSNGNLILPRGTIESFMGGDETPQVPREKENRLHGYMPEMWSPMGEEDEKGGGSEMPSLRQKDRTGDTSMSIDEALKIAKMELGIEEMPIEPKKRKEIASRVFHLCRTNREPPRLSKLEEF